jgi:hypothetical protein
MISVSLHINNLSKAKDSYSSKNIRTNRRIGIEKQLRGFHVKIYLTIGIVAALSIPQCWSQMLALCAGSQCLASLVSLPLWILKKLSLLELVLVHAASLTLSEQHICEIIDNPQQQFKEVSRKKGHWYVLCANASEISLLDLRHGAISKLGLHMCFNLHSQCNLIIYNNKCFPSQKFLFHKTILHQFPSSLFSSVLQLTCSKVSATLHATEMLYLILVHYEKEQFWECEHSCIIHTAGPTAHVWMKQILNAQNSQLVGGWQCSSSCHKDLASPPLGISCALEISQAAVSKAIIVGYKLTKTPVARAAHNYLPGFSPISLIPEPRICVSIAVNIKW